jgi:hypothetical protein
VDLYKLLEASQSWDNTRYIQGALWITKQLAGGTFADQVIARYTIDEPQAIADYMPHPGEQPHQE